MPKMKTHRGTAKRFRVTGSGKIMRAKAYKSHIMTKKSQKRKRNFRHETEVATADSKVVARNLGLRCGVENNGTSEEVCPRAQEASRDTEEGARLLRCEVALV